MAQGSRLETGIVNYLQLPMIAGLGYVFFGQTTDIWTWAGAAVICASTYYVGYRESRAARAAKAPTQP